MGDELTIQDLLKKYDCNDVAELYGYIEYLEDVKADYEYLKSRFRYFVDEMDKLY